VYYLSIFVCWKFVDDILIPASLSKPYYYSKTCSLSEGEIRNVQGKDIVTCPLHFSTFDIVTGKKLSEPKMSPPMDMAALPKLLQDAFAHAAPILV
jgi:hypothetical protein